MESKINIDILSDQRTAEDLNKITALAESELKPMTAKECDLLDKKVIIARTSDCLYVFAKCETAK